MSCYIAIYKTKFLIVIIPNSSAQYNREQHVKSSHQGPTTYMYSAIIVHMIGAQQSIVVVHFLQEFVIGTKQLQVHAGGRRAHDHLQLSLITDSKK